MGARDTGWAILIVALCGCGAPKPPAKPLARLDWSKIPLETWTEVPGGLPDSPSVVASQSIPRLPSRVAGLGSQSDRRQKLAGAVENARLEARYQLEQKLFATFLAELSRERARLIAELDATHEQAVLSAHDQSRALFEQYAKKRGPLVIRRNLLFEHPDRKKFDTFGLRPARDETAKTLKAEIDRLDEQYRAEVRTLYAGLADQKVKDNVRIEQQIEAKRKDAMAKAESEARRQADLELVALEGLEKSAAPLRLPDAPAKASSVAAQSTPLPGSVTIRPSLVPKDYRIQVEVWAALKGYVLTDDAQAQDRTAEFINWKKERLGR